MQESLECLKLDSIRFIHDTKDSLLLLIEPILDKIDILSSEVIGIHQQATLRFIGVQSFKSEIITALQCMKDDVSEHIVSVLGIIEILASRINRIQEQIKSNHSLVKTDTISSGIGEEKLVNQTKKIEFLDSHLLQCKTDLQTALSQKQRLLPELMRAKAEAKSAQSEANALREKHLQLTQVLASLESECLQLREEKETLRLVMQVLDCDYCIQSIFSN